MTAISEKYGEVDLRDTLVQSVFATRHVHLDDGEIWFFSSRRYLKLDISEDGLVAGIWQQALIIPNPCTPRCAMDYGAGNEFESRLLFAMWLDDTNANKE
jgi:hypothetical protein